MPKPDSPASAPVPVGWVSCVGEKGGAEVLMLNTARELACKGFPARMAQLRSGPLDAECEALGIPVTVFPRHRMRNLPAVLWTVVRIARWARRNRIGLLHGNGFRAHAYSGPASRLAGIPNVLTVHSPEPPGLFTRSILRIPCDGLVANCETTADWFRAHGGSPRIAWPGVPVGTLSPGAPREELESRFGIAPGRRWVSMVSRIQKHKGHVHFVRAVAAAAKAGQDVHGIVVGAPLFGLDEGLLPALKAEAASLGVAGRMTFTGFVDDRTVAGFQAASTVGLHTAMTEDFGIAIAESMARGVPVVAFAASGPSHLIQPGTGWLAPIGDQALLDAALCGALSDPDRLRAFGEAARLRVLANFTMERHAAVVGEIYHGLLAARNRG